MELSRDQVKLFVRLVEAARTVPRPQQQFELHGHERNPAVVFGAGLPPEGEEVLVDDIWALDRAELIDAAWNYAFDPQARFTITAKGERTYEESLRGVSPQTEVKKPARPPRGSIRGTN